MKRFISLFLVFSVLTLSMPLTAKERKGADLIIQKTDGMQLMGELIAVKENSLVLLDRESGADVIVSIRDIGVIKIAKKSKALVGAGIGLLLGGGAGAIGGLLVGRLIESPKYVAWEEAKPIHEYVISAAAIGACIGAAIGAFSGSEAGKEKTIQFAGKSDSEIQEILEELRKKTRIKNAQ